MGKAIRNGEAFAAWLAQHEPPPDDQDTESATREWVAVDGEEFAALPTWGDDMDTEEIDIERITQEAGVIRENNPLANADDDDDEWGSIVQRTQRTWLRAWVRWLTGG